MKKYDKEKLNEYAKELFALCLKKRICFEYNYRLEEIYIECFGFSYIDKTCFDIRDNNNTMPIWELIEKVKQL